MARIFLSYSRQDLAIAAKLAAELEHRGHQLWWDRQLHGGARFASEIEAALERSDAVVVLWSRHSLQSAWVQDEASEGRDSGRLVPVVIDGCKPPLGFRQFHAIDYGGGSEKAGVAAIDAAVRSFSTGDTSPMASPPPTKRPGRWRSVVAAVAAIGAAGTVILAWPSGEAGAPARLVIANFEALSPAVPPAAAAALGEEMLTALGSDPRISASREGGGRANADGFVASGSLRTSGDMLRITVHLKEAGSGRQLWTQSFDRPLSQSDVAPRQVGIAASMVIRCGLTGRAEHPGRLSDESLAAYLSYCAEYWAETGGREMSATRGLDFARQSVALEPRFSRGWSAVGRMASWAIRDSSRPAAGHYRREAGDAARKALSFDPRNSQAYEVLAYLEPRNSPARERLHAKSVAVRPGDCGCEHVAYGGFLAGVGRPTEALVQYERALDIVPTSVSVNASLAEGLFALARDDRAEKLVRSTLEIWPTDRQMHETVVRTAFWTGRTEAALRSLADPATHFTAAERAAYANALTAMRAGASARNAAARQLQKLAAVTPSLRPGLITALAALGANQEAMAVASKLFGPTGSPDQFVLFEPILSQARKTPEFAALANRIGLVGYWRESRKAPEFCTAKDAPPLCASLR